MEMMLGSSEMRGELRSFEGFANAVPWSLLQIPIDP